MVWREAFQGALEWEDFGRACEAAEVERDQEIALAQNERDTVLNAPIQLPAAERIKAAVEARYKDKVKRAQEICEKSCETALIRLMGILDSREKEQRLRQKGLPICS